MAKRKPKVRRSKRGAAADGLKKGEPMAVARIFKEQHPEMSKALDGAAKMFRPVRGR